MNLKLKFIIIVTLQLFIILTILFLIIKCGIFALCFLLLLSLITAKLIFIVANFMYELLTE